MELGEFHIKLPDELEESPGAAGGRAEVVQAVKEPLPNANTIEGVIQGVGIMAEGIRRRPVANRIFSWIICLTVVMVVLDGLVGLVASF